MFQQNDRDRLEDMRTRAPEAGIKGVDNYIPQYL